MQVSRVSNSSAAVFVIRRLHLVLNLSIRFSYSFSKIRRLVCKYSINFVDLEILSSFLCLICTKGVKCAPFIFLPFRLYDDHFVSVSSIKGNSPKNLSKSLWKRRSCRIRYFSNSVSACSFASSAVTLPGL